MKTCFEVRRLKGSTYLIKDSLWSSDLEDMIDGCKYRNLDLRSYPERSYPELSGPTAGCTNPSGVCRFEARLSDPVNLEKFPNS